MLVKLIYNKENDNGDNNTNLATGTYIRNTGPNIRQISISSLPNRF
jgi:hypothetical protein